MSKGGVWIVEAMSSRNQYWHPLLWMLPYKTLKEATAAARHERGFRSLDGETFKYRVREYVREEKP